jgi:DNA-directed RNA polymerase subunit RPC12/RpoP
MTKKYQTGIQETVLTVIQESAKAQLPYIKKKDILTRVSELREDISDEDLDPKVSQALYQLNKNKKYRKKRVRKFLDKNNNSLGWTVASDEKRYMLDQLPDTFDKLNRRISRKKREELRCPECGGRIIKKKTPYIYKDIHLGWHTAECCMSCGTIYFPEKAIKDVFEKAKRMGVLGEGKELQDVTR